LFSDGAYSTVNSQFVKQLKILHIALEGTSDVTPILSFLNAKQIQLTRLTLEFRIVDREEVLLMVWLTIFFFV
jgi:hypothetical protein